MIPNYINIFVSLINFSINLFTIQVIKEITMQIQKNAMKVLQINIKFKPVLLGKSELTAHLYKVTLSHFINLRLFCLYQFLSKVVAIIIPTKFSPLLTFPMFLKRFYNSSYGFYKFIFIYISQQVYFVLDSFQLVFFFNCYFPNSYSCTVHIYFLDKLYMYHDLHSPFQEPPEQME